MNSEKVKQAIKEKAVNNNGRLQITCNDAISIADKLGVAPSEVGKICNDSGVKIINCQLGCF